MTQDAEIRATQAPIDDTKRLVREIRATLAEAGKGKLRITREIPGMGIQHWRLEVDIIGGPVDLYLEARGLSLHEAALGMQVILEGVL